MSNGNGSDWDMALVRYNSDGSLDTSFDGDGKLTVDFGGTQDLAYDLTIQTDGAIVVTGSVGSALAVARFNSDGSPDTSFGTAGLVTTAIQASASGSEVVIQPNGGIVVAGTVNNGNGNRFLNRDFVVVRYDGSPANTPPDPAVDIDGTANDVAEGAADGTTVGVIAEANDAEGDTLVYTLTTNPGGRFAIDSSSGVVTVAVGGSALLNYEDATSHDITVVADDGSGAPNATSSQTFTINVTNVNPSVPVDDDTETNEVAEGAATGTTVGLDVSSTDTNDTVGGGDVTFSLTNTAGGRFKINTNTGEVSVDDGGMLDGSATHTITVQASDGAGGTSTADIDINVLNVAPTINTVGTSATKDNKAVVGNVVSVSAQFTNVRTLDTHTVIVDWGDGTTSNSDLDPSDFSIFVDSTGGGAGSFTGIHTYSTGGIFTVVVTVTDDDTGSVTDSTVLAWVVGVRLTPQGILQIVPASCEDLSEATVFAHTYITMGASPAVEGNLQSGTAVTLGANAEVDNTIQYGTALTYGAGATSGVVVQAIADGHQGVIDAQSTLDDMPDAVALIPGNIAADVTFAAGGYDVPGLLTVAAGTTITLDAAGQDSALFVFNISNYLTFGAGVNVVVINGDGNTGVVWNATGNYVSVGADANIIGTIFAHTYVSTGANSNISGAAAPYGAIYSATSYVSLGVGATVSTAASASFTIIAANDDSTQTLTITASATGYYTASGTIDVIFFDNSLTASQQAIFTTAANHWAQIITTGDVPDMTSIESELDHEWLSIGGVLVELSQQDSEATLDGLFSEWNWGLLDELLMTL